MSEIWIADWTFYNKGLPVKVDAVVTKRLPLKLLMANHDTHERAGSRRIWTQKIHH